MLFIFYEFLTDDGDNVGEHFKVYKNALKDGAVPMQYLKCYLVGIPQIGKTAVQRRLSKKITNIGRLGGKADWHSTGPAECSLIKIQTNTLVIKHENPNDNPNDPNPNDDPGVWSLIEGDDEYNEIMTVLNHHCKDEKKEQETVKEKERPQTQTTAHGDTQDSKGEVVSDPNPTGPSTDNIPKEVSKVIEAFNDKLKKADLHSLSSIQDIRLLFMIDVGGQSAFLEMLPLLMGGPAIYLTFFDLSKSDWNEEYIEKSNFPGCPVQEKESGVPLGEFIIQVLSSVAFSGNPTKPVEGALKQMLTDTPQDDQDPIKIDETVKEFHSTAALLIGTCKDKLKEQFANEPKCIRESQANKCKCPVTLEAKLKQIDHDFRGEVNKIFGKRNINHVWYAKQSEQMIFNIDNMHGVEETSDTVWALKVLYFQTLKFSS